MKFKSILTGVLAVLLVGGIAMATDNCIDREEPTRDPAPAVRDVTRSDDMGAWVDVNCDTDFERATYEECCGMPYNLWLQDHPYSNALNRYYGLPENAARPGITRLRGLPCE